VVFGLVEEVSKGLELVSSLGVVVVVITVLVEVKASVVDVEILVGDVE
jgi:hypothetical protein